mmetsp:Transcript_31936/g.74773  ORF Transcript_31936/g.74773 Transcript_31936/m.74773 type:complete len:243 (+) Transcript_31936:1186-1914(+)
MLACCLQVLHNLAGSRSTHCGSGLGSFWSSTSGDRWWRELQIGGPPPSGKVVPIHSPCDCLAIISPSAARKGTTLASHLHWHGEHNYSFEYLQERSFHCLHDAHICDHVVLDRATGGRRGLACSQEVRLLVPQLRALPVLVNRQLHSWQFRLTTGDNCRVDFPGCGALLCLGGVFSLRQQHYLLDHNPAWPAVCREEEVGEIQAVPDAAAVPVRVPRSSVALCAECLGQQSLEGEDGGCGVD